MQLAIFKFCCLLFLIGGCKSNILFKKVNPVIDYVTNFWFPDIEMNSTCVSEGCPALTTFKLCPRETNIDQLKEFFKILSECLKGPICGKTMDPQAIPAFGVIIDDLIPGMTFEGMCSVEQGDFLLHNASNIEIEPGKNSVGQQPIQLSFSLPNVRLIGSSECKFGKTSKVAGAVEIIERNMSAEGLINFSSNVVFGQSLTESTFKIEFQNPQIQTSFKHIGEELPAAKAYELISEKSGRFVEKSNFGNFIANYFKKLVENAVEVVSKSCD